MTLEELVTNLDAMNVSEEDWRRLSVAVEGYPVTDVRKVPGKGETDLSCPDVEELEGVSQ